MCPMHPVPLDGCEEQQHDSVSAGSSFSFDEDWKNSAQMMLTTLATPTIIEAIARRERIAADTPRPPRPPNPPGLTPMFNTTNI